jgi:hypothetical protein
VALSANGGDVTASWHVDGCLRAATVKIGEELICQDGEIRLPPAPIA